MDHNNLKMLAKIYDHTSAETLYKVLLKTKPGAWELATLLCSFRMCSYTTHSHTDAKPRLRWIIPTDRPMTPDEYPAVARRVAEWLDIDTMDATTYELARLMYWPTCSADGPYVFREQEGPLLRVDDVLHTYGDGEAWKDCNLWPVGAEELMSTEQTPVFFAAPKHPVMLSKLAKGRTESYGDSARGPTWQSHGQRFLAASQ